MSWAKKILKRAMRRHSELRDKSRLADATIRVTPFGAEVELADGPGRIFFHTELDEPAIESGIRWARKQGAVVIMIKH